MRFHCGAMTGPGGTPRRAAAAIEFVLVVPLLLLIFLGMVEVGRSMMVLSTTADAARNGARAAVALDGSYSSISSAVNNSLSQSRLPAPNALVVTVNGTVVTDDATFKAAAVPGATISVQVSLLYSQVSWLPAGAGLFVSGSQSLTETVVMRKEG